MTDRTKVIAVALALVSAGAAAILLAGSASAASWHTYEGDLQAGHAYGLDVPANAESVEFSFTGDSAGLARLGIYDPQGAKVAYHTLTSGLSAASIANPAAGRYVVYVYEIAGGALGVRVNSATAPVLAVQTMSLQREDVKIGTFQAGALDRAITANLKTAPVFVTLLYEGSAKNLDATVASAKGNVVTITGESATAFSPGVWTTLSGSRAMEPANLDGVAYTVTVHAERFEGSMVLTTLAVDFRAPTPGTPSDVKAPVSAPWKESAVGTFALGEGKAIAFTAKAGTLLLTDPEAQDGDEADDGRRHVSYFDVLSLYAPDDSLLGHYELSSYDDEPTLAIKLPVDGEYVAYVHAASHDVILAQLANTTTAIAVRELPLATESFTFSTAPMFLGNSDEVSFELARAPVALALAFETNETRGALGWAEVSNDEGVVASANSLVAAPGVEWFTWSSMDPENFRAGTHSLRTGGLVEGKLSFTSVSYLRDGAAPSSVEAPAPASSSAPSMPPPPPSVPSAGVGVLGL